MDVSTPFTGLGLYYPTMLIRDDTWLRSAFLGWSKITRIAPSAHVWGDAEIVRRLVDEVGFITSNAPSAEELQGVATEFANIITHYSGTPIMNQLRICDHEGQLLPEVSGSHSPFSNAPVPPGPHLSYILTGASSDGGGKVSRMLEELLRERHLAESWHDSRNAYIGVHPRLAWAYMSRLTQIMAQNRRFCPLTDVPDVHTAGFFDDLASMTRYLLGERMPQHFSTSSGHDALRSQLYLQVALEDALPVNIGSVPWRKLISFRNRHHDELSAFHKHISELAPKFAEMGDIADPSALIDHIEVMYRRESRPMIAELRRALNASGIDAMGGALVLKVDATSLAGTALGASAIAAGGSTVLTAAGVAAAIVPSAVTTWRQRRARKAESPVAYLLSAERLGSPGSILRRILPGGPQQ